MSGNQTDFRSVRVLIVAAKPHVVQVMRHVLSINGVLEIEAATSAQSALDLLTSNRFSAVFCDVSCGQIDGRSFAFLVRRNAAVLNPMVPLFLMCGGPRQRDVELARDTGYSDVLTRPVSAATVGRKLKQVTDSPRPFIATSDFFGPDRRGKSRPAFHGDDRRKRSARKVKIAVPSENFVEI